MQTQTSLKFTFRYIQSSTLWLCLHLDKDDDGCSRGCPHGHGFASQMTSSTSLETSSPSPYEPLSLGS